MKTVLAPIDFSDASRRVIEEAIQLARSIGGRLVLLNIVSPTSAFPSEFDSTGTRAAYLAQAEKLARDELATLQRSLRDEGVTAHVVHLLAQPGPGILEQAERLEADYVVMGSHGHGAFYELIVGGTASRVLKMAKCPVVIVPANPKRPAKGGRAVPAGARTAD